MAEILTMQIAKEYEKRASKLPPNGRQDIGRRRELRIELQERCGLLEIEAVNIINGFYADIYVKIAERREAKKREKDRRQDHES